MSTSTHTYIYNNLILNLTPLYGVSLANYIVDYICSGLMPTLQVLLWHSQQCDEMELKEYYKLYLSQVILIS